MTPTQDGALAGLLLLSWVVGFGMGQKHEIDYYEKELAPWRVRRMRLALERAVLLCDLAIQKHRGYVHIQDLTQEIRSCASMGLLDIRVLRTSKETTDAPPDEA